MADRYSSTSTYKSLMSIRKNVKTAVEKDYNVNHMITFLSDTEDQFVIDIFTDGLVTAIDPKTKQMISTPRLISSVRTEVKYKDLISFMKVVQKMIKHYESFTPKKTIH